MTDSQWEKVQSILPEPKKVGRPKIFPTRVIIEAIVEKLDKKYEWRKLPESFPAKSTIQQHFYPRRTSGLLANILKILEYNP